MKKSYFGILLSILSVSNLLAQNCDTLFFDSGDDRFKAEGVQYIIYDGDNGSPGTDFEGSTEWSLVADYDGNLMWGATAWFQEDVQADDWYIVGPFTVGDQDLNFSFWSQFSSKDYRGAYEIRLSNSGSDPAFFTEVLLSYEDDDILTHPFRANWVQNGAKAKSSIYKGQEVYFAVHHNAYNSFHLYIDDIMVDNCPDQFETKWEVYPGRPAVNTTCLMKDESELSRGKTSIWQWSITPSTYQLSNHSTMMDSLLYVEFLEEGDYQVQLITSNGINRDTSVRNLRTRTLLDCQIIAVDSGQGFIYNEDSLLGFEVLYEDYDPGNDSYFNSTYETVNGERNYYYEVNGLGSLFDATDEWLMFGPIKVPEGGMNMKWKHRYTDVGFVMNHYEVYVSTTSMDTTGFLDEGRRFFIADAISDSMRLDTEWANYSIPIGGSYLEGEDVYIGFNHTSVFAQDLHIDDIILENCKRTGLGVNQLEETFLVMTNMIRETLSIHPNYSSYNLEVFDINGQLKYSGNTKSNIDVRHWNTGLYFIRMNVNGQILSQKVWKD